MSDFLPDLVAELTRDEGLRLKPYLDTVGKLTIGYGRNLNDVGISEDEAQYLLRNDILAAERFLDANLPWWRRLDEDRQRVLCNMAFNLGPHLLEFHQTLYYVANGDYESAANQMMLSKWAQQVGPRAKRLADRMRGRQIA